MRITARISIAAVLIALVGAGCSGAGSDGAGTEAPVITTTTTNPSSTTAGPDTPPLRAHCGPVEIPVAAEPELPAEPLDADAVSALDGMVEFAGAEAGFLDGYEWFIADRSGELLTLFGTAAQPQPPDVPAYGYASFKRTDGVWVPSGWGQCRIEVEAVGFGNAAWILDAEPDSQSGELQVQINERACASGQPPVGREVVPVVTATDTNVTITVLVESVRGDATCPSNPWFLSVIDLGEPLGDRSLLDGSRLPPLARTWPPTQSSIDSLGSTE